MYREDICRQFPVLPVAQREVRAIPSTSLGERHPSFQMQWRNGGRLRYYLHGKLTTLTPEVEYPRNTEGHKQQISEIAQWSFLLANLKSVALGGPDLGMAFLTVLGVEDSSTRRLRDRGTLSGLRLFERFEC